MAGARSVGPVQRHSIKLVGDRLVGMRVLCAWEMGSGMGHLVRLRPFVDASLSAGSEVVLASGELERVRGVYGDRPIRLFKAPRFVDQPRRQDPLSWAEYVLSWYQSADRLVSFLLAWRSIFDAVRPDLVICDAAPTALLAGFGAPWLTWAVGAPFFMPRADLPFFGLYPNVAPSAEVSRRLKHSQARLLAVVRESMQLASMSPISGLSDISGCLDQQLLTTVPEFDYFGKRPVGDYLGMPPSLGEGIALPAWPGSSPLKIFAYLKDLGRGLERFLRDLEAQGYAALVYAPGASVSLKTRFPSHVFLPQPAAMAEVCEQSDLVVHTGGSQTVARCLAAGVPQLLLVPALEQMLTAAAASRRGAIEVSSAFSPSFEEAIAKAVVLAKRGRFAAADLDHALLDGSVYTTKVEQLVEHAAAAVSLAAPT